jgi:hypothetical protein
MTYDPIQNRLDVGDRAGAVRETARAKISDLKKQQDENLRKAFEEFCARHPEFEEGPGWKFHTQQMRKRLLEAGRDVATATIEDLEWAWTATRGKRIKSTPNVDARPRQATALPSAAPSSVQSEQVDGTEAALDAAAHALIAGGLSKQTVDLMSAHQYELKMRDFAFQRAVEILDGAPKTNLMTRGDFVRGNQAVRQAELSGADIAEVDREIRRSREERAGAFAGYQEKKAASEGGGRHYSGLSFGDRVNTAPGRRRLTADEARRAELENTRPTVSRADADLEARKARADELRRKWNG